MGRRLGDLLRRLGRRINISEARDSNLPQNIEGPEESRLWTKNNCPDLLKNLDETVREKAIRIANSFLQEGYLESKSIAMAFYLAQRSPK